MTNNPINTLAAPISQQERIIILDSLRGIALLGILLMNIPGFGLPENQTSDPSIFHENGWNYKVWYIIEWIFTGTQRAFFSMLFGAGIILFISNLERKVDGLMVAEYYFRRQLWLLVFGLFNAFILLWFWDILFGYAICGMLLFAFHRLSPKALMVAAVICLLFMTIRENRDLYQNKKIIAKGELVASIDTTKTALTELQKDDLEAMVGLKEKSEPAAKLKHAKKEISAIGGNYESLYAYQSEKSLHVELYYTYFLIWDLLIFMFLGMAFFKNGVFLGTASVKVYAWLFVGGLGLGLVLSYFRLQPMIENDFNTFHYTKDVSMDLFEVSRALRSLGFFGFVMLLYKLGWFRWFFALMQPVGQMAFTNYLLQSLICGLFFYGIGFGFFGKLQRYELYYVVAAVWVVEIIWSHVWLRYFRFGPLEWLWRSLTYWKSFSMSKH